MLDNGQNTNPAGILCKMLWPADLYPPYNGDLLAAPRSTVSISELGRPINKLVGVLKSPDPAPSGLGAGVSLQCISGTRWRRLRQRIVYPSTTHPGDDGR